MEHITHNRVGTMKETMTALVYAVAAVSGASGGCTVAAHHILRGRPMAAMILCAYAFVGGVFGVAVIAAVYLYTDISFTVERLILTALGFGFFGSIALAGANLSARFLFRRLGIEVDVSVKRIERRKHNLDTRSKIKTEE